MQMRNLTEVKRQARSIDQSPVNRACRWGLLTIASVVLSFVFTCATPFAALATFAALKFKPRDAWLAAGVAWLINQAIGYGCLNYPHTAESFIWGAGMGGAAYASLAAAMWFTKRTHAVNGLFQAFAALASAFASFKLLILMIGYGINGSIEFSWTNMEKMLVINIGTLVGLIAIHHLAARIAVIRSGFANRDAPAWREQAIG